MQLTCTMIQLANVSPTVGCPLATAEALVVLATTHLRVYGKYLLWWYLLSAHASWYKSVIYVCIGNKVEILRIEFHVLD